MDQPRLTDEQMLDAMKAGDISTASLRMVRDRMTNGKAACSKLSIRTDRDGKARWFHQTKGWRGLALSTG